MKNEDSEFEVVVVGAIGIDTNIYLHSGDIDFSVESNFSQNIDYVGQAGGYSSRGFAQLGKRTAFIGYIGPDYNGKFITDELAKDGIETLWFTDPEGTRRSINFMYRDGRRKNFYDAKGAMHLKPDLTACRAVLAKTRLVHLNIENWARQLIPLAKDLGLIISCDVQDIVSLEDAYRQDFMNSADVLFLSSVNFPDPTDLIQRLLEQQPDRVIVVGMGARGCALGTKDGIQFFSPLDLEGPVIDTNGAGDGLAVGFLSGYYLDGYSLEDAILRGQIIARYTCTQKASSSNLITPGQLDKFFRKMKDEG